MKEKKIYKLHQKYATSEKMLEVGWNHSLIVKEIAVQIADSLKNKYEIEADQDLIKAGALVHDIGIYDYLDEEIKIKKNYVLHGRLGYEILIKEGITKKIARFALVHIGVGYEQDIPISLEEEIVAYADSFHSKCPVRFNSFENEKKRLESFGLDKGVLYERFKDKFGIPNLIELKEKYKKWQIEMDEWFDSVK